MDVNFILLYYNALYLCLNMVCFIFQLGKKATARLEMDKSNFNICQQLIGFLQSLIMTEVLSPTAHYSIFGLAYEYSECKK